MAFLGPAMCPETVPSHLTPNHAGCARSSTETVEKLVENFVDFAASRLTIRAFGLWPKFGQFARAPNKIMYVFEIRMKFCSVFRGAHAQ